MRPAILRHFQNLPRFPHRNYSTTPPSTRTRLNRLLDRTPRFLQPYTNGLRSAPVSHIVSFLILHELTAIIPLIGLSTAFHYSGWTPAFMNGERMEGYEEQFRRYFGRKGWFGVVDDESEGQGGDERGGGGVRVVLEVATAYAITKALLPVRIIGSVWATPWFARVVVGRFKRLGMMGR